MVSYAQIDFDIDGDGDDHAVAIRLGPADTGVAIISRSAGRVVGFAIHPIAPGAALTRAQLRELADPEPVSPPALEADEAAAPTITVAICTRNRTDLLRACLQSLHALPTQPLEILVVDNAPSDDSTRSVAVETGVRYEVEPCPGLDFARNRALATAHGEVVAFVDDDVIVDRFWFDALRSTWSRHPDAGMVTGQVLPWELETGAQVAFERRGGFRGGNTETRHEGLHRDGDPVYPYNPGVFGAGANMSVRRSVALDLGEFDEALDTGPPLPGGGDIDMMHRVVRSGFALVYDPRAVVFHRHRRDRAGLRRQYESWGRSLMAFATKTYRIDPPGRRKIRRLVGWFFGYQSRAAARSLFSPGTGALRDRIAGVSAPVAELRGGVRGLFGTYGRSRRRSRRLRREHRGTASATRPKVAIIPWGDVIEDYTDALQMSIDDFAEKLSGGWLFGFVEAFSAAGAEAFIVCWSRAVDEPKRRVHTPTGAVLWILPPSRFYLLLRSRLADVHAWGVRDALGRPWPLRALAGGALARIACPYLTTTPRVLARVLRGEGADVVLCQEYEEGRFDVCVALGRLLRMPVFATFQGGDHTRTRVERLVRRTTIRAAAGFVVGAESEAGRIRDRYGIDDARIARIVNPLDPATVVRQPRVDARASLGIDPEARVAVWVGRVDVFTKGMDTLVDAWCKVRASSRLPVVLLLLGTGSGAPWLHDRLRELGLDDVADVRWRDEYVLDRAVVGAYLSAADVFVLASRQEGFPVAPVEAMAAGLPVVATDAPGVRGVVGDGAAAGGVVVPVDDPQALAEQISQFLDDPELSADVGARAAQRVDEHFSLDAVGAQLRAFVADKQA